jgi:hypothetical protein
MEYRFYFLGPDCRVYGRREFHADSDTAANRCRLVHLSLKHGAASRLRALAGKRHVHTEGC